MQGEAELALWLFDVKKAFAVDNLAAFVKVVFLQKLKGLKLVQFLEGLAAELAVDGQLVKAMIAWCGRPCTKALVVALLDLCGDLSTRDHSANTLTLLMTAMMMSLMKLTT